MFIHGRFKNTVRNELHPTLEELLDKYDKKKEVKVSNEELNSRNKSLVKKMVNFFKKMMPKVKRRKLHLRKVNEMLDLF